MKTLRRVYYFFTKTKLRKVLSFILATLIFLTSIKYLLISPPNVRAADELLGLNEGYGTTINDDNGNVSGTITNALWKTTEYCKTGNCLYFDGTGDYVSFGDDADLDFAAATNFTIEGWFRTPDVTSGTRVLVAKHNATTAGYKVYMDSNGYLIFGVDDDSTFTPDDTASTSTTTFDDNKWHHFSAVKTGTTSISLYVDGVLYQTDSSIAATGTLVNADSFYIGIDGNGSSNGFTGFLDEIKVYGTTARSSTEVKADFTGQTISRGVSASFAPDTSYLSNGLLGYWKMDETSGNAADTSGNNLTLTNNGTTGYGSGKFGNAAGTFDGSSQYFSTAVTVSGVQSISFWAYPASTTNNYFNLASGKYLTSSSGTLSTIGFSADVKIYVNGIQSTTIAASSWQLITVTDNTSISADTVRFGQANGSYYSSGSYMDEIRLYTTQLSSSDVQLLYTFAPSPVGYWKMDENSGTTAYDSSSLENNLTLTNSPKYSTGKFGSGILFAGSNAQLTRSDDSDFDFGSGYSFSFGGWFKHDTASAQEIILSKFNEAGYKILMESDGDITCGLDYDSTWTPTDSFTSTVATYDDGNWHHIDCVKNENSSLSLYIDGLLIGSDSTLTASTLVNSDPLYLGIDADGTSNDFTGTLDDFKIYNYLRTTTQIVEDMNGGHPAGGSPVGSSIIYWKLDEQQGSTANNSGFDPALDGTVLSTTSNWQIPGTTCKKNGCYNIVSNGNYISAGDTSFTDSLSQMSISLWVDVTTLLAGGSIVSKSNFSNQNSFHLRLDSTNTDEMRVYIASTTSDTSNYFLTSNLDLTTSTLTHLAIVYDGSLAASERVKVYKNGALVSGSITGTIPTSLTSGSTSNLKIGDSDTSGSDGLANRYDEFKLYNYALKNSERLVDLNAGSAAALGGVLGTQDWEGLGPAARAGWWKMDENTGTSTTVDWSSNERAMTMTGMSATNWVPGKFGSALSFDGSTNYLNRTAATAGVFNNLTISAWVKPDNTNTGTIYMQGVTGALFPYFSVNYESGAIILRSTNDAGTAQNASAASTNTLNVGEWNFIAVQKGSGNVIYTVNGVISTATIATAGTYTTTHSSIGALHQSSDTQFFDGILDEVQVFAKGVTVIEAAYIFNRAAPVIWNKLDECTGTTAYNSVLNANGQAAGMNGTITIGAGGSNTSTGSCNSGAATEAWNNGTSGKYNGSLDFDGTDDYVETADTDQLDFADADFTLEAWFYRDSATSDDTIIAKKNGQTSASIGYLLYVDDSTDDINFIATENGPGTDTYTINGRTAITTPGWHHIVVVWSDGSAANTTIYLDGVDDKESTSGTLTSLSSLANSVTLRIGEESDGGEPFDGKIDNVKIYRYAMPTTLIPRLYNEGAAQRFGP